MKLVIQGLKEEDWKKIKADYTDCVVIEDQKPMYPCTGCFSCWNRTPGKCVIKDGYETLGKLIHHAEEVIVLSAYTYGGFSAFVKNVFDRSLGYVLPMFEVVHGETHHKRRYPEEKPFTFVFYGNDLSEEKKKHARQYVRAVTANIRGYVKRVEFREGGPVRKRRETTEITGEHKVLVLNPSVRHETGNSAKLAGELLKGMEKESEIFPLVKYRDRPDEILRTLTECSDLLLCTPLYVDGLPSQLIRFMEQAEEAYQGGTKRMYVLANMGLYESRQLKNLFAQTKEWCTQMGFEYCGGLGVSAGELIGGVMDLLPFETWPKESVKNGMNLLQRAIDTGSKTEDYFAEPSYVPRALYLMIANSSWYKAARRNGLQPKELYRKL